MTEDNARKRWCPFSRVDQNDAGPVNRGSGMGFTCLASECMAWRWHEDQTLPITPNHEGYCGLAGKP